MLDAVEISVLEGRPSLLASTLGGAEDCSTQDYALAQPLRIGPVNGQHPLAYQAAADLLLRAPVADPRRAEEVESKLMLAAIEASDGPRLDFFCRHWAGRLPEMMARHEGHFFRVAAADPRMFPIVAAYISPAAQETLLAAQRAEAFGLLLRAPAPHDNLLHVFRHLRPAALEALARSRSADVLCAFSAWPDLQRALEETAGGRGMMPPWSRS